MKSSFFLAVLVLLTAISPVSAQTNTYTIDRSQIQPISTQATVEQSTQAQVQVVPVQQARLLPAVESCYVTDNPPATYLPTSESDALPLFDSPNFEGNNDVTTELFIVYEAAYEKNEATADISIYREQSGSQTTRQTFPIVEDGNGLTPQEEPTFSNPFNVQYVDGEFVLVSATLDGTVCESYQAGTPGSQLAIPETQDDETVAIIEGALVVQPVAVVTPDNQTDETDTVSVGFDPQDITLSPGELVLPDTNINVELDASTQEDAPLICQATANVVERAQTYEVQYGVQYRSSERMEDQPFRVLVTDQEETIDSITASGLIKEGNHDLPLFKGQITLSVMVEKGTPHDIVVSPTIGEVDCALASIAIVPTQEEAQEYDDRGVVVVDDTPQEDADEPENSPEEAQSQAVCRVLAQGTRNASGEIIIGASVRLLDFDTVPHDFLIEAVQQENTNLRRYYSGSYVVEDADDLLLQQGQPFAFAFTPVNASDRLIIRSRVGETICPMVTFGAGQFAALDQVANDQEAADGQVAQDNNIAASGNGAFVALPQGTNDDDREAVASLTFFDNDDTPDTTDTQDTTDQEAYPFPSETLGTLYVVIAGLLFLIIVLVVGFVYMLGRHHHDHRV